MTCFIFFLKIKTISSQPQRCLARGHRYSKSFETEWFQVFKIIMCLLLSTMYVHCHPTKLFKTSSHCVELVVCRLFQVTQTKPNHESNSWSQKAIYVSQKDFIVFYGFLGKKTLGFNFYRPSTSFYDTISKRPPSRQTKSGVLVRQPNVNF